MYIMFPIGWMYYFGVNLDERFSVPDFWPTQEQSHRIPIERDEIIEEVRRIARQTRERAMKKESELARQRVAEGKGDDGGVKEKRAAG
jgi:protein PET100, fungi type